VNSPAPNSTGMTPQPGISGPVLLVLAGGAVSQAAIARTAELAAGAPVTVVGLSTSEIARTDAASSWHPHLTNSAGETRSRVAEVPPPRSGQAGRSGGVPLRADATPEQVRRTVALAMSVLEDAGVMAMGHIVTGPPARAVARMARARGARVVILDQSGLTPGGQPADYGAGRAGAGTAGLMTELRRRMYGSGIVVLAETDRRGGWVSA
jgi:hypothetical protein